MSYKDALTNIGNRFAMSACVDNIDKKQSIGVVYCDVTGLKYVNDTMGHEAGDRLILNACACLTDVFGEDRVFRIGGDEFCVILEKTNAVEIHQILDSLERKINVYNEKNNIKISYAKGYEISTREHYYLMEELTKRADSRMYENKRLMKGKRLDGRRLNV